MFHHHSDSGYFYLTPIKGFSIKFFIKPVLFIATNKQLKVSFLFCMQTNRNTGFSHVSPYLLNKPNYTRGFPYSTKIHEIYLSSQQLGWISHYSGYILTCFII